MPDTTSFVIASTGPDEPGIIAAICESLESVNGSLGDSRMHRLAGMFNSIMVVSVPSEVSQEQLSDAMNSARRTGVRISVSPDSPLRTPSQMADNRTWLISSAGADKPGILRGLATVMRNHNCDFIDVSTQLEREDDKSIFVLVCEISAPANIKQRSLQAKVDAIGEQLGTEFLVLDTDMDDPVL